MSAPDTRCGTPVTPVALRAASRTRARRAVLAATKRRRRAGSWLRTNRATRRQGLEAAAQVRATIGRRRPGHGGDVRRVAWFGERVDAFWSPRVPVAAGERA
jgi:hypothetical protein